MKRLILIAVICCSAITMAYAQDSQGGTPLSFDLKNISGDVDLVNVQPPDLAKLAMEDADRASKSEPYRIGITLSADFSLLNSGTWTDLPLQNASLWRLTVKSESAKAIGFGYSSFFMPDGARLFLYNKDRSMVLGAFTSITILIIIFSLMKK